MPKIRNEKWARKGFSLSEEAIEKIKTGCAFTGLKESAFIEFLINQWIEPLSPLDRLKVIRSEKDKIQKEIKDLENKEIQLMEQSKKHEEWAKEKLSRKPTAIKIIQEKILNREYQDAERIAKTWSVMLGIPAISLISEAQEQMVKQGI